MKKLRIAYFGSPDFSASFLEKLLSEPYLKNIIDVGFVVTQPDRPAGRKQLITSTPVKQIAKKYDLDVLEIDSLKIEDSLKISNLKLKISKCDICLVYAYSAIIPADFLALPALGFWCIHPSLLPKYRGTSPMATALINGDKTTGMTIIKMDADIDHGPIIAQESLSILNTDYRTDLERKLTDIGFSLFKKQVTLLTSSRVNELKKTREPVNPLTLKPQIDKDATYTKKLTKQDGFIDFENFKLKIENSSEELYNLFRGLYPWPGLWTLLPNGKRLKIISLELSNLKTLKLLKVQLEGKNEVDFETFKKGYPEVF